MDIVQAVILALVQGTTEFLPISSSAHLILPAELLGWPDQGLAFDVAVHVGSLVAVMFYFRQDLSRLVSGWLASAGGLLDKPEYKAEVLLGWQVVIATMPAVIAALFLGDFIEKHLRSALVIASTTLFFGLFLGVAEYSARRRSGAGLDVSQMGWLLVIAIGVAQVFALIPGTSRSGVTMTAAILLGMSRSGAARFSFLLSMPIIAAAGLYSAVKLLETGSAVYWSYLAVGAVVSALSAWACIALFMRLIEKIGMMPFVWYRIFLAAFLFIVFTR